MFKRNTEPLSDILLRTLRQLGLETPLLQKRLIDAWPEVAGGLVTSYTADIYIKNQTLVVHLTNPALRADLMMKRSVMVKKLNAKVNSQIIIDIRIM
jgi:hypothetical protein